ncbi:hypothetical protein HORIV_69320 [Vreelandella olivaria]|uniref:Uncharacterized protein n=1 Tax=Vreelandella olivaria TaxID=390919 RepID=A0ABM7GUL7_9GAMM|nr:hypothetical protein HORIV_69320 [Halomonas olivaria]
MDFNQSTEDNLFDRARIIGKPHVRVDGLLKVTGRASYAYERHDVVANPLVGFPWAQRLPEEKSLIWMPRPPVPHPA